MTTRARVTAAYLAVCLVWGSTYVAIGVGVRYVPPTTLGAVRFITAGLLLMMIAHLKGGAVPTRARDWVTNIVVGLLLLGVGGGLTIWSMQYVTAGVASIFVVTVALWMTVFDAVIPGSPSRASLQQVAALVAGLVGTVLLVGTSLEELRRADWRGPITIATASWGLGSVIAQRRAPRTGAPYVNSALQQLAGGLFLAVVAALRGDWGAAAFSWPGLAAVAYLIVVGSIVGFTSYVYLLRHVSATVAGTYTYANTVVAVLLGWALLGDPITGRTVFAMTLVIGAVVWVRAARPVARGPDPSARKPRPRPAPPVKGLA